MPKTYPKTPPKKNRSKKTTPKPQKSASPLTNKYYWITLTLAILVFIFAYGYLMKISLEEESLMLGSIISVIGFALYLGFKPSARYDNRATFIFVGASIIGFGIWALMVLSLNAIGIISQIASSVGSDFFAITTLLICLILGAFIGDLIGKNRKTVELFVNKLRN